MAPYEALFGHKCRTPLCWTELGEWRVLCHELVSKTKDKVRLIRDRVKTTFDKYKLYLDMNRRDIKYSVGDQVFRKVSSWKKVLRFEHKSKFSTTFIRPY